MDPAGSNRRLALRCRAAIKVEGSLQYGTVALQAPSFLQLKLINTGNKAATWRVECEK
jgi:hypothetical protein